MNFKKYFKKNKVKLSQEERFAMDVSRFVFVARSRSGFTQSKLARKIKTKQPAIARLENGDVSPTIRMLAKIATACGGELKIKFLPPNNTKQ